MAKTTKAKLLSFTLPNKLGQLAAVSEALAAAKLQITAFSGSDVGNNAEFLLLVDKTGRAQKALASLGVELKEEDAIAVQLTNKPGRLAKVAKKLADAKINIRRSWATAFSGKTATCIMQTSDDPKAITVIKGKKA